MISAITHFARLARAGFVFAREGVFGVVDPSLVPPPGQLALRIARLIERPGAKSGPRLSRALTRLGPAYLKLGQFLATRPDVVGVVMARDLESLQDRLPPFSQAAAEAVIALDVVRVETVAHVERPRPRVEGRRVESERAEVARELVGAPGVEVRLQRVACEPILRREQRRAHRPERQCALEVLAHNGCRVGLAEIYRYADRTEADAIGLLERDTKRLATVKAAPKRI